MVSRQQRPAFSASEWPSALQPKVLSNRSEFSRYLTQRRRSLGRTRSDGNSAPTYREPKAEHRRGATLRCSKSGPMATICAECQSTAKFVSRSASNSDHLWRGGSARAVLLMHATAQHMMVRNPVERDRNATGVALTEHRGARCWPRLLALGAKKKPRTEAKSRLQGNQRYCRIADSPAQWMQKCHSPYKT
jgi:hypothetical protein